jgi:intracellular multiplication protein IcmO
MSLDQRKYERKHVDVLRDIRPMYVRMGEWLQKPANSFAVFMLGMATLYLSPEARMAGDLIVGLYVLFFWWLKTRDRSLAFKMPYGAKFPDKRSGRDGKPGKGEGILYLGNVEKTNEEVWFSNSDARTHILYLGTTGAGKTEGLKSLVSNALSWGSGFVYIDGKADTDLWSSLSSLVRRFGRDDDLLVLNYMTGNSDTKAPSNTMNPFSSGSASYLTNMMVSLMPDAEGDNAMWKERAVSLIGALMPVMTWKRDHQELPMSVGAIRNALTLPAVIKLSRDKVVPEHLRAGIRGYLDTLPGYIDAAFDDEGKEKPAGPDNPGFDTTTPRQQHGYLSMQFTRALQSLADDYGYIFDTQAADVDMVDVVLNRRILIVLIPALEKSADEAANLGKIVAATIKGMMGSTLGATVEGESSTVIENKPTQSSTPFMCVFDEVGYYAAQGMAVMAAQARSLGFCLVYSAQDLPAMEKRVKEEARSITANCNIKIFGKLEDPTQTKEFFEKTVGTALVMESSGFQLTGSRSTGSYYDNMQAGLQLRPRASYDGLRAFKEGQAVIAFGEMVVDTKMFYSNPGFAKAMRVTRYVALPPPDENMIKHASTITKVRDLMVHKTWTALKADVAATVPDEIKAIADMMKTSRTANVEASERGMLAVVSVYALTNPIEPIESSGAIAGGGPAAIAPPVLAASKPAAIPAAAGTPPLAATNKQVLQKPVLFKKPDAKPAEQPAEDTTPAAASQLPPVEETAPATAKAGGNPMGFFSKGKPAPTETPAAAPATAPAEAEAPPARPALDPQAEEILRRAGEEARKALLKETDDIGAAE